jgi:hypothetical protein
VSIKIRFRGTSETVVVDVEVQDQRHRVLHIRQVGSPFLASEWAVKLMIFKNRQFFLEKTKKRKEKKTTPAQKLKRGEGEPVEGRGKAVGRRSRP